MGLRTYLGIAPFVRAGTHCGLSWREGQEKRRVRMRCEKSRRGVVLRVVVSASLASECVCVA